MTDLTRGSILRHLIAMAAFIAAGLIFQSAYFMIDLYFVSRIGRDAVAGVSAAGNFTFLAIAGAQLLGVGSLSLISQAVGRKDRDEASLVFNQATGMAILAALAALVVGGLLAGPAVAGVTADAASAASGRRFLYGTLLSLACMFPVTVISSALRANGVVRPTMLVQTGSVLLNALLAPVLIAGVGTGLALGTFGAGLASSISAVTSLVALVVILPRVQTALQARWSSMLPQRAVWTRLLKVGLPAAGEFFLMFLIAAILYWSIRRFGAQAQAGYGIGTRIIQAMFLPTMAISLAAAPIAGQNYGARSTARVVGAFRTALLLSIGVMLTLTVLCQIGSGVMVGFFTRDPAVVDVAVPYLHMISLNFVASGLVFVCSGLFQAFGDTRPSFISSASRLLTFAAPSLWLSTQAWTRLPDFWHVSVVSSLLQAAISLLFLRRTFHRRLPAEPPAAAMAAG